MEAALDGPGLWEISNAVDARIALAQFGRDRFDLVLVDKNLPDLDGVSLIRQMRSVDPVVAGVLMTGYASIDSAFELLHLDIDSYLVRDSKIRKEIDGMLST